jgi:hypothetical protein
MPILALNSKVEVAKTFGSPISIGSVSKASPAVCTSTAHGLSNGDVILITCTGMAEINGQAVRVAGVTTNTFQLEGVDSTNYTTFLTGSCRKITSWDTASSSTGINAQQGQPNRIDVTTLFDTERQYVFGLPDSPELTIEGLLDPSGAATQTVRKASETNAMIPLRITFADGTQMIVNTYASAGDGFALTTGDVAKTTWSFTQVKKMKWYQGAAGASGPTPRAGVAAANTSIDQTFLDALTAFGSPGSDTGRFNLQTTTGNYGWVAVPFLSIDGGGVTFTDANGFDATADWAGANLSGQATVGSEPPSGTHQTFTDSNSVVWWVYRQNFAHANPTATYYDIN